LEELLRIGAAYIRVSTEEQDEYSPDSQLKLAREYAAKQGYWIPDEYVFFDDGISGKTAKKRPSFNHMIALAKDKSHPFDTIFVWKYSRFARSQEESIVFKNLLRKSGVSVVSVSEPVPEGHFGTLVERIIEWMDEFYLINLSGEVHRGMMEKASRGEPITAPPIGYIMKDGQYYPDPDTAHIVCEVFEMYAAGKKQREIAVDLGRAGVRTRFGKMPDNRFVDYILRNPCYIGKIRYTTDGSRAMSKRDPDAESIAVVNGKHEPIISVDLWLKVQSLLAFQKKAYPKYAKAQQPAEYMLKGLVRCSNCGSTLALSSAVSGKSKTRTMQCCNYARGSCHVSHSVTMPKIELAFMEGLKKASNEQSFTFAPDAPKTSHTAIDYDKLVLVEERKLQRAEEAYLAEIDTLEQYAKRKKEILAKIAELKDKRDRDLTPIVDATSFAKKVSGIVDFIERDDVTEQAKNEALRNIIEKVVFEKAKGNLAIYFHDI
jgi:DNA invertase Pin-like site-specific DNA recombinase